MTLSCPHPPWQKFHISLNQCSHSNSNSCVLDSAGHSTQHRKRLLSGNLSMKDEKISNQNSAEVFFIFKNPFFPCLQPTGLHCGQILVWPGWCSHYRNLEVGRYRRPSLTQGHSSESQRHCLQGADTFYLLLLDILWCYDARGHITMAPVENHF